MRTPSNIVGIVVACVMLTLLVIVLIAETSWKRDCEPICGRAGMTVWSAQPYLNRCLCNASYT